MMADIIKIKSQQFSSKQGQKKRPKATDAGEKRSAASDSEPHPTPPETPDGRSLIFFCFFFLSGFCSLMYQVVWLRMAMADFGVTTAQVSILLSVFMAGLALGGWAGGAPGSGFSFPSH